ncbi:hypothetical protein LWP59_06745 [Amycolatopsis acidiphila]|uniref:hypothetical protein n=1 Tax=Amycolatopsis acidiphila TaxID=715473 RepID=UPI001643A4F2|nr:hypothetical protein [Amycolatopsis acidiphila]UIJ61322.1 hypothetical protein LWP59_06745 [Amycolatopsis acidiphila]GHG78220.1 hypothetical protein GCM10017788_45170 [Amycolatopsis acidiphila]
MAETDCGKFTDEELAFLRHVRFGTLPPRSKPADLVETVETEQPWLPTRPHFDPGTQGPPLRT